jgi:formate dehydrogenase major subunit
VPLLDDSHVAMRVNLDACIQCGLCVRACREVQVNDVIGMAGRGHDTWPVFDFADPMGESTCVACGECVQACPTGALMEATVLDSYQHGDSADHDSETRSVCPFCGVGCQVTLKVKDGRVKSIDGAQRPGEREPALRQGPLRLRLHPPPAPADQAADPPRRRREGPERRPRQPADAISARRVGGGAGRRRRGLARLRDEHGGQAVAGFGSAKCSNEEAYLFQRLIREGFGHNNVDHCTRLCHASSVAALLENVGSAPSRRPSTRSRTPMSPSSSAPTRSRTTPSPRPISSSSPSAAAS